eukprot:CAMPEP_0119304660 /NCGR_PEP_ID=MMETSP1333-20130426/5821_1 /TAXON_ID=418940 /ORGANISM="Scyphosphaera apsteinii, Strain RCC1455" /LENGTH=123 /DNA_ID=CAMNT_0007307579 /DNA_START=64 /DNA_END=435 /DNA_ORIENTATION=+
MSRLLVLSCLVASALGFLAPATPTLRSKLAASKLGGATPKMSLEMSAAEQIGTTLAGVVAVDGGTIGLDVSFGAFLAVILGLFIPVVFLVTLFIQSEAQGTARTFRQPDNPYTKTVGILYEDE